MPLPPEYDIKQLPSTKVVSDDNEVHLLVPTIATLATAVVGGEMAARTHNTREEKAADLAKSFVQRSAQALEEDLNSAQLREELETQILKDFKTKDDVLKKFDAYVDKWREYHEQEEIFNQSTPDLNKEIEAIEKQIDDKMGIRSGLAIEELKTHTKELLGTQNSAEKMQNIFAKLEKTKNKAVNNHRQVFLNHAKDCFDYKNLSEEKLAPHKADFEKVCKKIYQGEIHEQALELINNSASYKELEPKLNILLDETAIPRLDEMFETLKASAIKRVEHIEAQKIAANCVKNIKIMELPKAGEIFASALKTTLAHGSLALPVIAATTAVGATTAYLCNQHHHR